MDCKTVVFFCERERRSQHSNEKSGASVEMGVWGSRASHARITLFCILIGCIFFSMVLTIFYFARFQPKEFVASS